MELRCNRCNGHTNKLFKCKQYDIILDDIMELPPVCLDCIDDVKTRTAINTLYTISKWFMENDYRTEELNWFRINQMLEWNPEEVTGEELEQWLNY